VTHAAIRWVAERTPGAPSALAAFVAEALSGAPGGDSPDEVARACLWAGERALARVLSRDAGEHEPGEREAARGVAHELLTADALVTYAFEAGAESPDRLGALARDAMAELSRVGLRQP
jgi:hypothetical protein